MSSHGVDRPLADGGPEMKALAAAVGRAIAEVRAARERAAEAEAGATRSDDLLREFVDGTQDPGALAKQVSELEAENQMLRSRIQQGQKVVDKILARIRFIEDGQ